MQGEHRIEKLDCSDAPLRGNVRAPLHWEAAMRRSGGSVDLSVSHYPCGALDSRGPLVKWAKIPGPFKRNLCPFGDSRGAMTAKQSNLGRTEMEESVE